MDCRACRKCPQFVAQIVGSQAEVRDTTGWWKQMGWECKGLPVTELKGKNKQICHDLLVCSVFFNQIRLKVCDNTPAIMRQLHHYLIIFVTRLKQQMKLPTFTHPLISHPHWAIGSEHLFQCGAKRGPREQCVCCFTAVSTRDVKTGASFVILLVPAWIL